jgi:hypothetical protein
MKGQTIQLPKKKGQKRWVQKMDYKILLRKLKTGDYHLEPGWTGSGQVHAPIVLLLLWIWF